MVYYLFHGLSKVTLTQSSYEKTLLGIYYRHLAYEAAKEEPEAYCYWQQVRVEIVAVSQQADNLVLFLYFNNFVFQVAHFTGFLVSESSIILRPSQVLYITVYNIEMCKYIENKYNT